MEKTFIYVTTQKEFIHQYVNAPDEVSYLRYPHRHVAHIKVKVQVFHDDREIEFIMFKHQLDYWLDLSTLSNKSCENIAHEILSFVINNYGKKRDISIVVSEDGENGCELIYEAD